MTNMTYVQAVDFAIANLDNAEVIEKLEALKAQLAKRGSAKTPSKTQKANEEIKDYLVRFLAEQESPLTISEMMAADEYLAGFSNQKLSALLRQLKETEAVEKTMEGKKAYFSLK